MATVNISSKTSTGNAKSRSNRDKAQRKFRSDSPYQQRTTERDNPTQMLIKQAVEHLIQQLEAGKSESLTAYLNAMARFHNYSFGNVLSIARQKPDATRVAGIRAWNELGRFVKKGEKGIQILAPVVGHRRKKSETEQDGEAENKVKPQPVLIGFRAVYVFDVSQTEGAALPEFDHSVSGDVGGHRDRLIDFLNQQNIALEFNEKIAPALGVSYGGKIALLPGQSKPEEFTTLVHETAHELLHKAERRTMTTATVRETEAEAVAFIVGQAIGLEVGSSSADYIQLYHGDVALLTESLEVIQRTSAVILGAITEQAQATESKAVPEVA
ncbi:MAG: ArdC-like ssDNA-binding domain-containing protein [Acidobacteria bacterium]|nr:ArdC-like ssDNA-binding domain-containing protein [Acidobacteriota bacterium]